MVQGVDCIYWGCFYYSLLVNLYIDNNGYLLMLELLGYFYLLVKVFGEFCWGLW